MAMASTQWKRFTSTYRGIHSYKYEQSAESNTTIVWQYLPRQGVAKKAQHFEVQEKKKP